MHCPTVDTCHVHPGETFDGVASGSFVAQNHEYPSHLRLSLTATDSGGLSQTTFVDLYPQTSTLTLASEPPGATLALGSTTAVAPFSTTVITAVPVDQRANQTIDGQAYVFAGWSDGGAASHDVVVSGDTTLTATFRSRPRDNAVWRWIGAAASLSWPGCGDADQPEAAPDYQSTSVQAGRFLRNRTAQPNQRSAGPARRSVRVSGSHPARTRESQTMATKGILGRKLGMTQVWDAENRVIPVTVIQAGPCRVVQLKTPERDGYSAVQLAFGATKARRLTKPELGHLKKGGVDAGKHLAELRVDDLSPTTRWVR